MTLRSIIASVTTAAILILATACGSSTSTAPASAPSVIDVAPVTAPPIPQFTPQVCASGSASTSPQAITPRVDGVFVGHEDHDYLVVLRYYPDHTVYLAVVLGSTPIDAAKKWVQPHPNSNTGPFPYGADGAFIKPVPAGDIHYTVQEYAGDTLVLHAVSHHGCYEHSIPMKFHR